MDGATVRVIATSSGWSTGVLSHYFEDKTDLLLHALVAVAEAAGRRMEVSALLPADAALRDLVHQALPLDDARRIEWRVWLAFWGKASSDPRLAAEQGRLYRRWRRTVDTAITRAQREGSAAPRANSKTEAMALVVFIDGLGLQASLEPDRFPALRQRRMVDAYLRRALGDR
mgnify:FL=1